MSTKIDTHDITDFHVKQKITEGIVIGRKETGTVYTNVPHSCIHHSPSGYEFGYAGSGPADLALNICQAVLSKMGYKDKRMKCWRGTCFITAWNFHQDFKFEFIAPLDRDKSHTLDYKTLVKWFEKKTKGE